MAGEVHKMQELSCDAHSRLPDPFQGSLPSQLPNVVVLLKFRIVTLHNLHSVAEANIFAFCESTYLPSISLVKAKVPDRLRSRSDSSTKSTGGTFDAPIDFRTTRPRSSR